MRHAEADRLHAGLIGSFAELLPRIEGAQLEKRPGFRVVICPAIPVPGFNGVWVDGPDSPAAFVELRDAVREVEDAGAPCWLEIRAGATPAFEEAAQRLGFGLEESIPGMVLRSDELVAGPSAKLEIIRAQDAATQLEAATVAAAGFGAPAELFAQLLTPRVMTAPGLVVYVARTGGESVSTATAWTRNGGVGIFNVATPPAHRGHGYGRAITERAIRDGFGAGADLAWLQSSALGQPVYRAMGFRQVETYLLFSKETAS